MAKKSKPSAKKAKAPEPQTLRGKMRAAFWEAGFTDEDIGKDVHVNKFGDGVLLGKLFELALLLGPILGPILKPNGKPASAAGAADGEAEFVQELQNAAATCGLTEETHAAALGSGLFGAAEKWLRFALAILPFLKEQLSGAAEETDDEDDDDA